MPLMDCCRVDDTSPDNKIVGLLQTEWIPMFADCSLHRHQSPQPSGTWVPSRSLPVSWWSERRAHSPLCVTPHKYRSSSDWASS